MMTPSIDQKQTTIMNLYITIESINQTILTQKGAIQTLETKLHAIKEIDDLNLDDLATKLSHIDSKKMSVLKFDYLLAKKINLTDEEISIWQQASKAEYESNTMAYLIKAKNIAASLSDAPFGIGSTIRALGNGIRFISGNYDPVSDIITPSDITNKIRNLVSNQLLIQTYKTKLIMLYENLVYNEQQLLNYNTQIEQLKKEINLLINDEYRKEREKENALLRVTIRDQAERASLQPKSQPLEIEYLPAALNGFVGAGLGFTFGYFIIGPILSPCTFGISLIVAPMVCTFLGGIIGFAANLASSTRHISIPLGSSSPRMSSKTTYAILFSEHPLKPVKQMNVSATHKNYEEKIPDINYLSPRTNKPFPTPDDTSEHKTFNI